MKIAVLIPMKGNSERVPNKNLRLFDGKPLYHAIVSEILKSKHVNQIVINTDSEKIKEDCKLYFPSVILVDRPQEICGDFVPMNDVIEYDMKMVESDIYIQTHSTNPLLKHETLDEAIGKFLESNGKYDSVFSVTRMQTRLYWEDGKPVNHNPAELLRTQDLPPVFEENSNFFIFTKDSFEKSGKKRIGLKPLMFPMNKIEAQDIDEPEDFILAETLYKIRDDIR
jgi:CMP-N-acetylneuraminic acid synthetase